jgi:hypothetical protein
MALRQDYSSLHGKSISYGKYLPDMHRVLYLINDTRCKIFHGYVAFAIVGRQ